MSSNIDVSSDSGLQREQSLSAPGNTELSPTDCKVSKNFTGNYPYQPLQSNRHIRLLRLEPPASSSTQGNPISATLHEVKSIGYPPSFPFYTALSYEWGLPPSNPSDTPTMLLGNYTIHIGQNLYDALHSILHNHHRLCGESPLYLWVDALCINQLDDREKGHQVQLMKTIYEAAEMVIIWLGMGTEHTDRTMEIINMEEKDLKRYMREEKLTWKEWEGIVDIYCNATYWRRVWILQEFFLARDYVVLCNRAFATQNSFERGLRIFEWEAHALAVRMRYSHPRNVVNGRNPNWPFMELSNRVAVRWIIGLKGLKPSYGRVTLDEWLDTLCSNKFKATDPRDYVFAMLGISHDGDEIMPDYELSTSEVYSMAISTREARDRMTSSDDIFYLNWADLMGISQNEACGLQQMLESEEEDMSGLEDQDMWDSDLEFGSDSGGLN